MKMKLPLIALAVVLVSGISYAVWKTSFSNKAADGEAQEPAEPALDHQSDHFLLEEMARFKTKSGVAVTMASYSECEACDAPEFVGLETETDTKMNAIPSPQEHNFSETPDARLKSAIVFGGCSDEVIVFQELNLGKAAQPSQAGLEYRKYIATILPTGKIDVRKETLTAKDFESAFKAPAPAGCEIIQQNDVFAVPN